MKNLTIIVSLFALLAFGCAKVEQTDTGSTGHNHGDHAAPEGHTDEHTVNGWCVEHGVPEDDCTACSKTAAEKHKKDGDWCDEHNVAKSQCFVCNPKLKDEFAAKYKAQFGTDLPQPHKH
ncbi:MAG: hypothetical protein LBN39_03355 [Planctomycetaceae bacterium]|jgi:hypothetical protein|nr:hypothetical protein [Planctomycetaceae bacterium]